MRRRKRALILCLCALLVLSSVCAGCGKKKKTEPGDGECYVYYVNQSGTALLSRVYELESTDTAGQVEELLEQCRSLPDGTEGRRAVPASVTMAKDPEIDDGVVSLYFDATYTMMDQVTELLCRAALAKTLTQLDEVNYISIYVSDAPEAMMITGSDFVDNTGDATNQYTQAELILYFGSSTGTSLVQETRYVVYSSSMSLEKVVLNQLIEGPSSDEELATLPGALKVQEVSVRDGVCYVDFDSSFLEEPTPVTDAVELYSVVNSLTALSTVNSVQITVNGSSSEVFKNSIPLSNRLEQNLDYVDTGD